jgi:hypothetical protein
MTTLGKCPFNSRNIRSDLEALPPKMKGLGIDPYTGYPVPWFVAWVDGKPEFRMADGQKWGLAATRRLCWVCGGQLGTKVAFVSGPMCGINRTAAEPPCHYECAHWSAINCPFLNLRQSKRREDEVVNVKAIEEKAAGIALTRNPGVTLIWVTRTFKIFRTSTGPIIEVGDPVRIEWYAHGRAATRAEVEVSIASGLPSIERLAITEPGGMEEMRRRHEWLQKMLPDAGGQ